MSPAMTLRGGRAGPRYLDISYFCTTKSQYAGMHYQRTKFIEMSNF